VNHVADRVRQGPGEGAIRGRSPGTAYASPAESGPCGAAASRGLNCTCPARQPTRTRQTIERLSSPESGNLTTDTAIWPDSSPGRVCGPGSHARRPGVAGTASRPQPSRPADRSRLIDPATVDVRCCSPNVTPCARPFSAVPRNIRPYGRLSRADSSQQRAHIAGRSGPLNRWPGRSSRSSQLTRSRSTGPCHDAGDAGPGRSRKW
jgi:hypothetical protein